MKIAIIGAGVIGLLTALEFLDQGEEVIIFDQQDAGHGASWAGGGILSPMYPWRYPAAVNVLAQYGQTMYQQLNQRCREVTGIDFEINTTGILIFDESDFDIGLNYANDTLQPLQKSQLLHDKQLKQLVPQLNQKFKQALYFPHIANVRNPRLLKSLILYLKQHSKLTFYTHTPIHHLRHHHDTIHDIITQDGTHHQADAVILCTGAWSAHWQALLSIPLEIKPIHGQMVLFKTPVNWLSTLCMNKVMYLIPRQDGHIVCGSSMLDKGFDTQLEPHISHHILEASFEMIPDLAHFPIIKQWAGLRPATPHGIPKIGKIPHFENLWANFGHFRNGLVMAPASARLLRQQFYNQNTLVDPTIYQF